MLNAFSQCHFPTENLPKNYRKVLVTPMSGPFLEGAGLGSTDEETRGVQHFLSPKRRCESIGKG